jgi:phosphopantothenoylcysteine decarboxylase/phosphopantothenate--cysteine ligase
MYAAVHREIGDTHLFIACAAVSDYRPRSASPEKIKRSSEQMGLDLVRCPDTLASVAALARAPFTVGFAAETQDVGVHAREKLVKKGIDMIAANRVGPGCGFDKETNALEIYWNGGERAFVESSKTVLARELIALVAERYRASKADPASAALAPTSQAF